MLETLTRPEATSVTVQASQDTDLRAVLDAWHAATDRLQQTHETLQREVRRLTDELEIKNRELARKNRLADLGQMASHVAHEVRNSLVPLTLYLSLLRRHVQDCDATCEILNKIEAGFIALETIVNDLLQFTSHRAPSWQDISFGTARARSLRRAGSSIRRPGNSHRTRCPGAALGPCRPRHAAPCHAQPDP